MCGKKGHARVVQLSGGHLGCRNLHPGLNYLLAALSIASPVIASAQSQPHWSTSTNLVSPDGHVRLRWSCDGGEPIALFRLTEEFSGHKQISFTDQAEMQLFRSEPGTYEFRVQACRPQAAGYSQCGEHSAPLTLTIKTLPEAQTTTAVSQGPDTGTPYSDPQSVESAQMTNAHTDFEWTRL